MPAEGVCPSVEAGETPLEHFGAKLTKDVRQLQTDSHSVWVKSQKEAAKVTPQVSTGEDVKKLKAQNESLKGELAAFKRRQGLPSGGGRGSAAGGRGKNPFGGRGSGTGGGDENP